jgi:hypothetical protein
VKILERSTKLPKPAEWQKRAWVVFDEVGQIKYAIRYRANVISRVRMFAGIQLSPDENPIPIGEAFAMMQAGEIDVVPELDAQAVVDANDLVNRIQSETGGQAEIMRSLSVNLDVPGECYLIRRPSITSPYGEDWEVVAIDELEAKGTTILSDGTSVPAYVIVSEDGSPIVLDPEASIVFRIWRRHERWRQRADSSLRGVLEEAEDYLLLRQGNHAIMSSRIANAGLLVRSSHFDFDLYDPQSQDPDQRGDVDDALADAMETAIRQPRSSSAAVPVMVSVDKEDVRGLFELIRFDRNLDGAEDRADKIIRRMAQGVDLPVERILGIGDSSTFANAELVTADEFEAHIEPSVFLITSSLTAAWYRPGMGVLGYPPSLLRRLVIGFDASDAVRDPKRPEHALAAHAQDALSNRALVHELGFTDADMPSVEELLQRRALQASTDGAITEALLRILAPEFVVPRATPITPGTEIVTVEGGEQVEAPTEPVAEPGPPLLAAANPRPTRDDLDRLAKRLAEIDRGVFERVLGYSSDAVSAALRIAGTRLRSATQGNAELSKLVSGVESREIPSRLGRSLVAQLAEGGELDFGPAIEELQDRYDEAVRRGQRAALRAIEDELGDLEAEELARVEEKQDENRLGGWLFLSDAVKEIATARAFDPNPKAPPLGEFDTAATVPSSVVRDALARAGGETGTTVSPGGGVTTNLGTAPVGGVATGPTIVDVVEVTGRVSAAGYRWIYGDASSRTSPFEPHEALSDAEFFSWESPQLLNDQDWPPVPFYFPGDHAWCQCSFEIFFGEPDGDVADEADALSDVPPADSVFDPSTSLYDPNVPDQKIDPSEFGANAPASFLSGEGTVKRDALGGQSEWEKEVAPARVADAKASGLYDDIAANGVVEPVDVFVPKSGIPEISSGHHRIAVAADLKIDVPVRWYGPGYFSRTGFRDSVRWAAGVG